MNISRHVVFASAATLSLFAAMTASATTVVANAGLSSTVSFAELNLNTQNGVDALYARLRGAAKQVCAPFAGRELWRNEQYRECVNDSLEKAVQQVGNARLTAAHQATKQARA